ncbi:MAG: hypothetical protein ACOC5M_00440 [Chloroflexota bacterium]
MSGEAGRDNSVDHARLRASMARLAGIYQMISDTADESMKQRCPYKDARARCTARFPCLNQYYMQPYEKPVCTGSDRLDYRSAWQV